MFAELIVLLIKFFNPLKIKMMIETLKKKFATKGNTLGWYALGIPVNTVFSREEEEEEEKEQEGNNEDEDEETGESASASGRKGG